MKNRNTCFKNHKTPKTAASKSEHQRTKNHQTLQNIRFRTTWFQNQEKPQHQKSEHLKISKNHQEYENQSILKLELDMKRGRMPGLKGTSSNIELKKKSCPFIFDLYKEYCYCSIRSQTSRYYQDGWWRK